ncbi:methyl-accepting chemotaxis protein [Desulfomicrobium baculatum]|uniref:Methyl-accepting chemotaxis sensory transducer n=1 Tax=Desulfomicrobium baculatum (strain DSM 4028 / VKM B-1378 / X) TaxID=525897 RepID=C7LSE2_DESBD|nr:methyl-accepting chemotaxis protein [Desulfomicrobium baculatum]ACU88156.1 methyl-accepting chemotaxis sensory transducer [Desulfomicrobium baculatum DSM 4028]
MFNTQSIKFTTKLFTGILSILILSLVSVIAVTNILVKDGLESLGRDALENINNSVFASLETQNSLLLEKLVGDMTILEGELDRYGSFDLDPSYMLDRTIINQVSKESEQVSIPRLMLDGTVMNGNTGIVDKVQYMTGGVTTIFQVMEDKLLRVSTNVRINETDRAVDTYIPADSPVYKTVMSGETYTGRAFVVDDWYVTSYKPVYNADDKIVAVLFVGRKILTPQLREMLTTIKAGGAGYFFVYNSKGEVLIHPSLEGKNIFEVPGIDEFFRNHKGGFLDYEWNGEHKITYTRHFEPWDWHLAVGLSDAQMIRGLDKEIITKCIFVGIGVMLLGVLIAVLLIRSIARPLNQLAGKSLQVAEGDYTIAFTHPAKDAIGHLSDALNTMVARTKDMLGEINTATQSLATASTQLSAISSQMTEGSAQTAHMATTVSNAAEEVSGNMNSVSAAMEQASMNMTTVASAAEEMSATIQEIAQNSERAKNTTTNAVSKAKAASGRVDELGAAAKEISLVTSTITAISSQTNLLALNATIEAARAGEAGRGFAVVANEIKELAQQTAKATEDIRERITGIQSVTTQTVGDISDITGVIAEMNEIVGTIAAAVEEQSVTTRDIAENVGQASTGITEINSNVATSSSMTHSISTDIEKVRSASDEMTASSQTVQQSAMELSELAERLRDQVSRFKI